ncbi:crossover junction endodeoxyribonuclease RuvC [Leptotrichia sp. OH3620_COT-345]|uniref:crossover junction endodeoxyribonuclease RuvC n=1 Tax=Leptotrichia sp. OH3620_COT-345 TaxID=2491048 RepID=UPI000F64C813|nr:crossover junction endodeoxyribonuclease RuvC [Leptotrichia sp. OH3620_COT-345]RRD38955.1 crossover junction endodeoxyribonuclease RuvC [Leptotrichia sp. OH3620_COT-345]
MRILGIDPGTAIVGYSIVDFEKGKYEVLDYGCIYTDKDEDMPARLEKIYDGLNTIIKLWKPIDMAIEELYFFKNQKTIVKVGQARGVITLVGQKNGMNLFSYTPLQVKMGIAGYGRADKKQIQEMVKVILRMDEVPKPDDAADALAIAITHVNSKNSFGGFTRGDNITKKLEKLNTDKIKLSDYKKLMDG